jgi:hypothetical protein
MKGRVPNPKATFSIGFAVTHSRDLLRQLHAPDDACRQLAERVLQHLETSGSYAWRWRLVIRHRTK